MVGPKSHVDYVYLDNLACASREDADQRFGDAAAIREWTSWNIWRRRVVGWDIEDGSTILLVASWPEGGATHHQVRARVQARTVLHAENLTWDKATKELGVWTGYGTASIRQNDYTLSKKNLPGPLQVLAYRADTVELVDFPLPAEGTIGRNGWGRVDASIVGAWPLDKKLKLKPKRPTSKKPARAPVGGRGGQGRLDKSARDAVEKHAMERARAWCRGRGWTKVKDTSRKHPWDLEATDPAGRTRFIEVKGTTGRLHKFDVTQGEVTAATRHANMHALVTVLSIQLASGAGGTFTASGGNVRAYDPWKPLKAELKETRYTWSPKSERPPS